MYFKTSRVQASAARVGVTRPHLNDLVRGPDKFSLDLNALVNIAVTASFMLHIEAKWPRSTDHIQIEYSIGYEGTGIRKLSPGTRRIVILLVYMALEDPRHAPHC